jgi:GAF domain-containing protein
MGYISMRHYGDSALPWLTIIGLVACLYAVGRERQLTTYRRRLKETLTEERDKSADLEGRLMELSGLYRAISAVNVCATPETTFDAVLHAALDLVGGNRGSLMLLNEDDSYLVIIASEGISEDVVSSTRQKLGEGVAGWVAENREPILLSGNARDDDRFQNLIEHSVPVSYSLSVPLVLRESVLGVLNVCVLTEDREEAFDDHDLRLTTIFAQHASVAIENARLRLMHHVVVTVEP